jgi:hypothetical protein
MFDAPTDKNPQFEARKLPETVAAFRLPAMA